MRLHFPELRRAASAVAFAVLVVVATPACTSRIVAIEEHDSKVIAGPFPEEYESIARRWIESEIRNLAAIDTFTVERPTPGFSEGSALFGGSRTDGWRTVVRASGRDSVGMGTGLLVYALLLRDGKVVEIPPQEIVVDPPADAANTNS